MSILIGFLVVVGILVGIPLLLWAIVSSWRSGHITASPGKIVIAAIAGLIVLGWLWNIDWSKVNIDIIISVGILLALAIGAIFGKFGTVGKFVLAGVAIIVVLLGPTGAFKLVSNVQSTTKEVVLEGKPILSASAPQSPAADAASVENVVLLALNQCTEPILVQNGWCISAREEVLGKGAIRTEVMNMSTQTWEMLPPGTFRKARYWRYCASEEGAKVFYSVYKKQPGEGCKSNTR